MIEQFVKNGVSKVIRLPRMAKRGVIVALDVLLLEMSLWATVILQYGYFWPNDILYYLWLYLISPVIAIPLLFFFGLYHAIHRYVSAKYFFVLVMIVSAYAIVFGLVVELFLPYSFSWTFYFQHWMLNLGLLGGIRWAGCSFLTWLMHRSDSHVKVAVYGAGDAGAELVSSLAKIGHYIPAAFIDDQEDLHGSEILGLRIYPPKKVGELINKYGIQEVLVAMPSVPKRRLEEIVDFLNRFPVKIKTVPGLWDIVSGRLSVTDVRNVDIEDLLGREPVMPDEKLITRCVSSKSVLVTGAGGSIGSELASQILALKPSRLILYEMSEVALYHIERKLSLFKQENKSEYQHIEVTAILGSVLDETKLRNICKAFKVETIYHTAAYKHVPMVEINPISGVYNNLFGTWYAARAATDANVETFIFISSDKAVRPTNVMGASKRLAELVIQGVADLIDRPRFSIVRFGNVLGSSGSIIPLLKEQIKQGGPVTITHPEIIRYFMTIPEAAQLVIQAGALGENGDVLVLDMGEPVKIMDLAKKMVSLSGLTVRDEHNPNGDIDIVITGLRPGEKLYEELLIGGDNIVPTEHPRILRAHEISIPWGELTVLLDNIKDCCERGDVETLRRYLLTYVSGYKPQCHIKDPVWQAMSAQEVI